MNRSHPLAAPLRPALLLLFLLIMVIPNAAQEPADVEEATPLVLVSVRPSRGATSESVGELIEQVTLMRVETLAQGAVEVTAAPKTDEAAAGTGAAGAPGGSGSSLQLLAESAAADLVLSVVYGGVREITVVCTVYDPASGRTTGPVYETTTLSLTFDQTVESLVDAALAPYAGRLEELLRADEEPAQPKTAAVAERPSPPTPTEAATEAPGAPPVPADDEPPASPGRPAAGIAVATGAFLPLGGGSGYLSVGAVQSAYASFPLAPVPWVAVGMEGGVVLVDATGASAHSRVYLVPFAASVRLATSNGSRIRPLAALSGGGSLISVDPNGTGRLWKLVGYAAGATGVGVALGSRFSLMVLTSMHVFFEPGRPIVAFAPSVSAQLDL